MGTARAGIAALTLLAAAACDTSNDPSTPAAGPASTSISAAAPGPTVAPDRLRAALLAAADVPGHQATPTSPDARNGAADVSGCFPGNPLARNDGTSVRGDSLVGRTGNAPTTVSSEAEQGNAADATAFISTMATQPAATCVGDIIKRGASAIDGGDTTVSATPSKVTVGDGGALVTVTLVTKSGGASRTAEFALLCFRKGGTLVTVQASSFGAPLPSTLRAEDLAQKIATRL